MTWQTICSAGIIAFAVTVLVAYAIGGSPRIMTSGANQLRTALIKFCRGVAPLSAIIIGAGLVGPSWNWLDHIPDQGDTDFLRMLISVGLIVGLPVVASGVVSWLMPNFSHHKTRVDPSFDQEGSNERL